MLSCRYQAQYGKIAVMDTDAPRRPPLERGIEPVIRTHEGELSLCVEDDGDNCAFVTLHATVAGAQIQLMTDRGGISDATELHLDGCQALMVRDFFDNHFSIEGTEPWLPEVTDETAKEVRDLAARYEIESLNANEVAWIIRAAAYLSWCKPGNHFGAAEQMIQAERGIRITKFRQLENLIVGWFVGERVR